MVEILIKADERVEAASLLRSAIEKEIAFFKTSLMRTEKKLSEFQEKHGRDVEEARKTGMDDMEIIEWEGEKQTKSKLLKKIKNLKSMGKCI